MRFYLSNQHDPLDEGNDLWNRPLPNSRQGNPRAGDNVPEKVLTYGQYFSAVASFIASRPDIFTGISGSSPGGVSVYLEKHGAFYHPSRIVVGREHHRKAYALNVAFSEPGREYLENEYNTLKMLAGKYAYAFLPRVFALGSMPIGSAGTVSMFAGEWFGSYHEFHASGTPQKKSRNVRVWDPLDAGSFLSQDQACRLYTQAAMILTACYDIQTFEHVASWHHAAGDFVVNLDSPERPLVKLVTVRRYTPMLVVAEKRTEAQLNGLLLFLLDLSIRMRLDRLDGVKEISWLDDIVVGATIQGFFEGLALQSQNLRIPESFTAYYTSFLAEMDKEGLLELFRAIANRFPADSSDTAVIRLHIEEHAHLFHQALQSHR